MVPVAHAECMTADELVADNLAARYKFAEYRIERHLIGMQAVIDYLEDEDVGTATLVSIKDNFEEFGTSLADAETVSDYTSIVADMKDAASDFSDKAKTLAPNISEARLAVNSALTENEASLGQMLKDAYDSGKAQQLERFDQSVCRLEERAEKIKGLGYDVSEAEEDIADYKGMRSDVEDAFDDMADSCEDQPLAACDTDEKDKYDDLKSEVKDNFLKARTHMGLVVTKQLFTKTSDVLDKLEGRGIDVSEFRDSLIEIEDRWDALEEQFNDSKYNLGNDIRDIREDIQDLRKDIRDAWNEQKKAANAVNKTAEGEQK